MPSISSSHSAPFYALLAFILLAPIPYGSNREWAEAILLLYSSALAIITLFNLYKGKLKLPKLLQKSLPLQCLFGLFIVWQILQINIINSADINHALSGLLLSFCYWIVFNLVLILCQQSQQLSALLWTIVISGLFQAFYGSMMVLTGIEWLLVDSKQIGQGVATGTFVNRNHLAGYLELTLACGLGLLIAQLKNISFANNRERLQHYLETLLSSKIILRLILCILVIALVMTRSRMGNAAFFTSMFFCGALHLYLMKRFNRSAIFLFVSLLFIDTLIVSQWFGLEELAQRMNITLGEIEIIDENNKPGQSSSTAATENINSQHSYKLITGDSRDEAWAQARSIITTAPLMGYGYGSFYTLFPKFRDGSTRGFFDHAHNDYLEIIIEFGFIGAGLLFLIVLIAVINAIQTQRQRRSDIYIAAAFASMMSITSIAIHSWTDFNLYIPANAMLVTIIIAISVIARWQKS
ncbi:MAG: O-antigen ligase family protein [Pseudomonadales bacterium]|nr:O-antigen ligase family protein [Pseudomonadales bacterium]